MAPAVLPWPALRSLLDAVGFAIAVSVAKQSTDSVPRVYTEENPFCFACGTPNWGHPCQSQSKSLEVESSHQDRQRPKEGRGKADQRTRGRAPRQARSLAHMPIQQSVASFGEMCANHVRSHCAAKDVH